MYALGVILMDTACLSESAGIATAEDMDIVEKLESLHSLDKTVFRNLQTLKTNISHLSYKQVLTKDMKITCNIPIVGLPISAKVSNQ